MPTTIRIVIADDHATIREATRAMLELESDIEIIDEACNGLECVQKTLELNPHVVITDVSMPVMDGIEACRQIKAARPRIGVVCLTTGTLEQQDAFRAGADAYVLKDSPSEDLFKAIRRVYLEYLAATVLESIEPRSRPVIQHLLLQEKLAPEFIAEAVAGSAPGESICSSLVRCRFISDDDLAAAFSEVFFIPRAYLAPYPAIEEPINPLSRRMQVERMVDPVERDVANLIPEQMAREHSLVAISRFERELAVAMSNPLDDEAVYSVERVTGLHVQQVVSTPKEIARAIARVYGPPSEAILQMQTPRPAIRQLPVWWPKALKYTPFEITQVAAVTLLILGMLSFLRGSFGLQYLAAVVGLTCGFFFFLYGAKYYATSAAVLAYSTLGAGIIGQRSNHGRRIHGRNGNGHGNGSGHGFANGGASPYPHRRSQGESGGPKTSGGKPDLSKPSAESGDMYRTLRGHFIDRHGRIVGESGRPEPVEEDLGDEGELVQQFAEEPFVSVHLATYNEKNVIERLLVACTAFDYENYEVIVADDSSDESVQILERWKRHPRVKIVRRPNRKGFKGGALQVALRHMNPHAKYVMIFDADFVPAPDSIRRFIGYFEAPKLEYGNGNGNGNGHSNGNGNGNGNGNFYDNGHTNGNGNGNGNGYRDERVAVVQGYQWHMLNAGENWVTKGVRTEFSGSYVVERSGQELFGGMKMISGSVYMIRSDILRHLGWSTSITEDWELTIRLYLAGYKVLYTPYIQAPAECVSSFNRLTKQRMRWAEGHTYNVKKYFWQILRSPNMTLSEKMEFLYYAPYYLQAVLFTLGTVGWVISEFVLHQRLPNWTATLGWALVFSNILSLPVMNLTGIVLERSTKRDLGGILAFVALSNLLVPFQAYAALKGLFEKEEGGWTRTPKSGKVTELLGGFRLRTRLRWVLPRRQGQHVSITLGLRRRLSVGIASFTLVVLILLTMFNALPLVFASPESLYLHRSEHDGSPGWGASSVVPTGSGSTVKLDSSQPDYYWYTDIYPVGDGVGNIAAGPFTFTIFYSTIPRHADSSASYYVEVGHSDPDGSNYVMFARSADQTVTRNSLVDTAAAIPVSTSSSPLLVYADGPKRIRINVHFVSGDSPLGFYVDDPAYPTNLSSSKASPPLDALVVGMLAPALPLVAVRMRKRWAVFGVFSVIVVELLLLSSFATTVPVVYAGPQGMYLHQAAPGGWPGMELGPEVPRGPGRVVSLDAPNSGYTWYSEPYPVGIETGSVAAGPYSFAVYYSAVPRGADQSVTYYVQVGYSDPDGSNYVVLARSAHQTVNRNSTTNSPVSFPVGSTSTPTYFYANSPKRIVVDVRYASGNSSFSFYVDDSAHPASLSTPNIAVPENTIVVAVLSPVMLLSYLWLRKAKRFSLARCLAGRSFGRSAHGG